MPLFMDIHNVESDSFSVEDVVKAHMKDLTVEKKFGVSQIKYWVNVKDKTIFCLMRGPDKESCNAVHAESHGLTACNIIEVSDDEFNLFLGQGTKSANDLAQTNSGKPDAGFRTLLLVNNLDLSANGQHIFAEEIEIIKSQGGSRIIQPNDDILVSFTSASQAIRCAIAISDFLQKHKSTLEFRIGLSTGNPVDERGSELFEETRRTIHQFCILGENGGISIDSLTKELIFKEQNSGDINTDVFKNFRNEDFFFINSIFNLVNQNITKPEFTSSTMNKALGLSKSQAYRRIKALTDIAPGNLIQEIRLRRSLNTLKKNNVTVAEIAYEHGFNSPTYYSRVFRKRFGISPSAYSHLFKDHK